MSKAKVKKKINFRGEESKIIASQDPHNCRSRLWTTTDWYIKLLLYLSFHLCKGLKKTEILLFVHVCGCTSMFRLIQIQAT